MDKNKYITENLIPNPVVLHYDNKLSVVQKIAGSFLLLFSLIMGIGIILMGIKADENDILYILLGAIILSFPIFAYLLIQQNRKKQITQINIKGVILRNNSTYNWENLQRITYTASTFDENVRNRYNAIEFIFSNGKAVTSYKADKFQHALLISNHLQVPKIENVYTNY